MNAQRLDAVEVQAVALEQILQRRDREVAQVLVVDRVELAVIDQIPHVGRFDHGDAGVFEQCGDAGHETVGVGHVCQHVVGVNHVGSLALRGELCGELRAEEGQQRIDTLGASRRYGTGSRVDAQHRDAPGVVVLQQVAVVAGELDDQALGPQSALRHALLHIARGMPQQRVRERREIRVVGAEQLLGRHGLQDLHECAAGTESHIQRITSLYLGELRLLEKAVR